MFFLQARFCSYLAGIFILIAFGCKDISSETKHQPTDIIDRIVKIDTGQQFAHRDFYILNIMAVKSEAEAKKKKTVLENDSVQAGYLWIPDYPSLSGAPFYTVYFGPFATNEECYKAEIIYQKKYPGAYGLLVSRERTRSLVPASRKYTETPTDSSIMIPLTIQELTEPPPSLQYKFETYGGYCDYSSSKTQYISILHIDTHGHAVMKINDKFIVFQQNDEPGASGWRSDQYQMKMLVLKSKELRDGNEEEGYIIISDHRGNRSTANFFGGCGD